MLCLLVTLVYYVVSYIAVYALVGCISLNESSEHGHE